jgi:hypothetical protein
MKRRDWIIVGAAFVGVIVYVLASHLSGGVGFPLDDSWIHQVYGRNLGTRLEWAFIPGEPSAASTSPLYTVMLAIGYALRVPFYLWTYAIGAIGLAATGLIAARLAEMLQPNDKRIGLIVGLITVTSWHFVWAAAAGMETINFCAFSLALIYLTWRRAQITIETTRAEIQNGALFGLIAALLTLTRPEGAALVALCGGMIALVRPQRGFKNWLLWGVSGAIIFLIVMSPYLLLNLRLTGGLLPNTSAAKQAESYQILAQPFLVRVWNMIYPLIAGIQLVLLPGFVVALRFLWKARQPLFWVAVIWPVVLILLYAWRLPAPYQHGRYVIPALAPYFVLAGIGTISILNRRYFKLFPRVSSRALAGLVIVMLPVFWLMGMTLYVRDVRLINGEMVLAAQWMAENVPADKLFVTHDIGAIGYFAPRPIFDLAGLITPEIIPIITDPVAVTRLMEQRGAVYMMVSDAQLPMFPDDKRLCKIFETPGEESPIHMKVYRLAWDRRCP